MLVKVFAVVCLVLLSSPQVRAQSIHAEDRASDFELKGVGLTETLLKFADQQHLPIAVEYVDRDSINRPIDVSLRNQTIAQALDSILSHGERYVGQLRSGIVEITKRRASRRGEAQLNTGIPAFDSPAGRRVAGACGALWSERQV